MNSQASCVCDSCGETMVVRIDPDGGSKQEVVEDCPVC
ncbi:MAG TPA: CPXCG motif-containing cysteine-rich protein [Planctomycetes bacterium]|nr:CPXCG motif-containing cysteine-rich protein [Planctomycetota bacterium]HIK61908.1 CPXCG motif-containing cysteine-rich protein [Planctomycetota bacterium]